MTSVEPTAVDVAVREVLLDIGVPVITRVPGKRPSEFIRLSVAGGGRANLVQIQPLVIVECWADNIDDASDLANDAWGRLEAAYGPYLNASVPVDFPDPESGQQRWQFTIQPIVNLIHN